MRRGRALALSLLLAAGCTGGTTPEPDGAPEVASGPVRGDISFLVFGEPEELKAFRDVVAAFEDAQPKVDVTLIEATEREDLLTRLSTSLSAGEPPDVFLLNYRFYGQYAARDVIEPIEPYVARSDVFREEDFFPEALDAFRWGDRLTCMPQNISSLVVYYNRDLFRRASLAEPAADWSWEEMVGYAQTLTRDLDGDGVIDQYGLGIDAEIIRLAPLVWSNGGELVDDDASPTRLTVDTPEGVDAIRRMFELREFYNVIPTEAEIEAQDDESRFLNGTTAMVLSSRRSTPTFRTIEDFEWDVAPLPILREPANVLHSDAYCMAADSKNKSAAWAFMEFALGPEGQRLTAATGRTVPSMIEIARSNAFLDPAAAPASSQVFLDTIPALRRLPSISTWPEIEDAVSPILENAMYQRVTPLEAARQMIEATTPIFARGESG